MRLQWHSLIYPGLCLGYDDWPLHPLVYDSFIDFAHIACWCDSSFIWAFTFLLFTFVQSNVLSFSCLGNFFCFVYVSIITLSIFLDFLFASMNTGRSLGMPSGPVSASLCTEEWWWGFSVYTASGCPPGDDLPWLWLWTAHYCDVIMGAMASQITSLTIVCSTVYSGADQRKHQSSASLAFVRGMPRWPVNSRHKGPVKRKMFPFDDVIMVCPYCYQV